MNKKILDFPEAAELANDDYIIFDSESGGGCRILGKKIAPVILGIEAIYTQTQEVTPDTPLNDLKQDLVVNALYRNNRKKTVTDYTLTGTLSVGTSTVTVTYSGFTTTFNVEVSSDINYLYNWDFTQPTNPLVDKVKGISAIISNATISSDGIQISASNGYIRLNDPEILKTGTIIEIDIKSMGKRFSNAHGRFIMNDSDKGFIYRNGYDNWQVFQYQWGSYSITSNNANVFDGKTMKIVNVAAWAMKVYAIDKTNNTETLVYDGAGITGDRGTGALANIYIGSSGGASFYDVTIAGVRIYDNI